MSTFTALNHLAHRVESVTSVGASACSSHTTVSIGIPTFNRASQLARAVASCRAQTYPSLAIIVSDNASTDDTERLCRQWQREDPRLTVIRQPRNIGRELNFRAVLDQATSEYFMWLSDDDWLDPDYVASCIAGFDAHPASSIVLGSARYSLASGEAKEELPVPLSQPDPAARVVAFLRGVGFNVEHYGVMRREAMLQCQYPVTLAGDWFFVSQMVVLGPVVAVPSVVVHRDLTGASTDMNDLARSYGLPPHWGYDAHLWALLLLAPSMALGVGSFGLISVRQRARAAVGLAATLGRLWWTHAGRWRTRAHKLHSLRGPPPR
jgi:hypothetical protein